MNKQYVDNISNEKVFENFLTDLGLNLEEAKLFIKLIQQGTSTILNLSRLTKINRTKIYRIVERLEEMGLVHEEIEENKRLLKPVDLQKLDLLIKQEEEKVTKLRNIFPEVTSMIPQITSLSHPTTKVVFYRGQEGVRQQGWNTLQAKEECVGFTYRIYAEIVGQKFAEDWRDEIIARNIRFREIYCEEFFNSEKETNYKYKGISYPKKPTGPFESRFIPAKILKINHQMDIYNNVVSIYNWYEGEVFGVEIYNEKVAAMQKQFFEIVWKIAKPPSKNSKS